MQTPPRLTGEKHLQEVCRLTLVLFNDLTRRKEPFVPVVPGRVGFYACGPTVYDFFHIGNARPFIVFDVLRRYLDWSGYSVTFIQNFTDIDDKMIDRANREKISVPELARRFIDEYYADADALGIKRATVNPKATEHMPEIIALVKTLIEKGHAYESDGDVFFDVGSFSSYGKLSRQSIEELQAGARIDINERKRNPLDFALWKAEKPGEPSWESPWGPGRPGWHIECSAMSMKYLGETIDIHSGGSDLIFPHHENEIAQAEAATGKPFVRFWLHNGYLLIDKEKMSKSLGNFLTAREARKRFNPLAIRLFMLSAHYRSPINFSEEGLQQAVSALDRLRNCSTDFAYAQEHREFASNPASDAILNALEEKTSEFIAQLDDDFNTAGALGTVFEVVRIVNTYLKESATLDKRVTSAIAKFFGMTEDIFGIINDPNSAQPCDEIELLIQRRNKARASKDYAKSDAIRKELLEKGIILEDTPDGTKWKRQL